MFCKQGLQFKKWTQKTSDGASGYMPVSLNSVGGGEGEVISCVPNPGVIVSESGSLVSESGRDPKIMAYGCFMGLGPLFYIRLGVQVLETLQPYKSAVTMSKAFSKLDYAFFLGASLRVYGP